MWKKANPSRTEWQDLKMDGGLLVGSGLVKGEDGAVEWLKLPELTVVRQIRAGKTDRGVSYTQEGMEWRRGKMWLLPEDAPSRLFEFVPVR